MWQVIGQNQTVSLLKQSLAKGQLSHAYLLVGPPHVGKMTIARLLAQALNCTGAEPPCGECTSCEKIASGMHADVQVIGLLNGNHSGDGRPQTEISINQIRDMQQLASLPPFEGRHKVFIIEKAELLSNEAANCLLKTLEEPAERVIFILLTVDDRRLPATVISRCQRLELLPLPTAEVEKTLLQRGAAPHEARLLARLSHGRLGWAIAASADERLLQQRAEILNNIIDAIDSGYDERFAYAARLATQFSQDREAIYEMLKLWLDWWHDLLLMKIAREDSITNIDRADKLAEMTKGLNLSKIKVVISCIQTAEKQLRQNANAQLVLESLMLTIPRR